MEFLVEITVELPPHLTTEQREHLIAEERSRGKALATQGILRAIWRVPGQFANRAIWSAPDATELHKAITSLPLWPYAKVNVTALARHDLAPECLGIPASLSVLDHD
jgi:muconolactone D-isomerase